MAMPIQFRLKELMAERERITGERMTYAAVAEGSQVNKNTIWKMATQQQQYIALKTLERLCSFFECDLSDLLVWVDGNKAA